MSLIERLARLIKVEVSRAPESRETAQARIEEACLVANAFDTQVPLGGILRLTSALEARITFSNTRVGAAFNPQQGAAPVAGGGRDQYHDANAGVAVHF